MLTQKIPTPKQKPKEIAPGLELFADPESGKKKFDPDPEKNRTRNTDKNGFF